MKGKKIIIISIIINILSICVIYNFIKKDYLNNEKIIIKAMTGTEYENSITSLNTAHEEYANYIEESKKKIASAITDMGVTTSDEETLENMANNIKSIDRNLSEKELLWSNNTVTAFAKNSTIDLDLSDYKYIVIGCVYSSFNQYIVYNFLEVGSSGYCITKADAGASNYRLANIKTTGITFTEVSTADRCIPTEVYGIK